METQPQDVSLARRAVCGTHGAFFLVAGLWPLLHLDSFEFVTGPKKEDWLVKGMGTVLATIGVVLVRGSLRKRVTPELALLANGVGLGLATLDVFYSSRGRIRRVYRLHAAIQAALALAWAASRPCAVHTQAVPVIPPTGSSELD